jgi:Flp pilus assembly protein TadB
MPALLFAVLGCFFLQKAIRRGAKQSWSWGRGGGAVPVSRWGYASWAITCFAIAVVITHPTAPPAASVLLLLAGFVASLVLGFVDTRRYHRTHRPRAHDPS